MKLQKTATDSFFSRVAQIINEAIIYGENNRISCSNDSHPVRTDVEDAGEVILGLVVVLPNRTRLFYGTRGRSGLGSSVAPHKNLFGVTRRNGGWWPESDNIGWCVYKRLNYGPDHNRSSVEALNVALRLTQFAI